MRVATRTALFSVLAGVLGAGCDSHTITIRESAAGRITLALPGSLLGYRAGLAAQSSSNGGGNDSEVVGIRVRISLAGESRTLFDKTFGADANCNDTGIDVSADQTACTLTVEFSYPAGSERSTFQFVGDAQDKFGTTLYKIGPSSFTLSADGSSGTVTATAVYVGPGSDATAVVLSQRSVSLAAGATATVTCSPTRAGVPTGSYAPMVVSIADDKVAFAYFIGPTTIQVVGVGGGTTQLTCALDFGTHAQDVIDVTVSGATTSTLQLLLVSANNLIGTAGAPLSSPIVLKVVNLTGQPVPGVQVVGVLTAGSLSPPGGTTDANGLFTTSWTLGPVVGIQTAYFGFSSGPAILPVFATAR